MLAYPHLNSGTAGPSHGVQVLSKDHATVRGIVSIIRLDAVPQDPLRLCEMHIIMSQVNPYHYWDL